MIGVFWFSFLSEISIFLAFVSYDISFFFTFVVVL